MASRKPLIGSLSKGCWPFAKQMEHTDVTVPLTVNRLDVDPTVVYYSSSADYDSVLSVNHQTQTIHYPSHIDSHRSAVEVSPAASFSSVEAY